MYDASPPLPISPALTGARNKADRLYHRRGASVGLLSMITVGRSLMAGQRRSRTLLCECTAEFLAPSTRFIGYVDGAPRFDSHRSRVGTTSIRRALSESPEIVLAGRSAKRSPGEVAHSGRSMVLIDPNRTVAVPKSGPYLAG